SQPARIDAEHEIPAAAELTSKARRVIFAWCTCLETQRPGSLPRRLTPNADALLSLIVRAPPADGGGVQLDLPLAQPHLLLLERPPRDLIVVRVVPQIEDPSIASRERARVFAYDSLSGPRRSRNDNYRGVPFWTR